MMLWIIKYSNYIRLFKIYMPQCESELTVRLIKNTAEQLCR